VPIADGLRLLRLPLHIWQCPFRRVDKSITSNMTREYLLSKGWTTYFNAYNTEKWVGPGGSGVMLFHTACEVQELAEYYGIEFQVKA